MTVEHFYKELAIEKLAELRAIKSVKLSTNLSSERLKCATARIFTLCLKTGRFNRNPLLLTANEGEIPTTTARDLWGAYLITVAHFCKELAS